MQMAVDHVWWPGSVPAAVRHDVADDEDEGGEDGGGAAAAVDALLGFSVK